MNLTIEQSCPSCGAQIVLNEDDKLIRCEFCDVTNFRLDLSASRYVLPFSLPDDVEESELIYVPYLRFKGTVYFVENDQVRYKIVDTTRLALELQTLPPSLGLRPQAMKIRPVTSKVQGQFYLQTVPVKEAFLQAAKLVDLFSDNNKKQILHRAFIGETISLIYQPLYLRNGNVIDAVDKRSLGAVNLLGDRPKTCKSKKAWEPLFISTICPACGGLLQGERDSRVLRCGNCNIHWAEEKTRLVKVHWSVAENNRKYSKYFPFWKIHFSTTGHDLKDYGALLRFTNQPIIAPESMQQEPLYFFVPAFKVNPKTFLQIASQLTIAQGKIPEGGPMEKVSSHPVTLNKSEAVQSIKSILAHLTVGKKKKLLHLSEIRIEVSRSELVFLPFAKKVHDYIQVHTPAALQVAAVRYGRSL
ncbi:hypothetical protein [Desulforhopalus sp. IMCC35007]|uniref:hypothetical protein n=1 Tax=Desulforhopalus sp. IMCC35007 TaxID=2569543 RepID=UPI0010AE94D9|nr:hypothetical protein [Desulforhopalus sp. IMCC35007]TKB09370.1 hypothetical protein FCL48_10465 [Desulforhopalus sp. IMCC35007]